MELRCEVENHQQTFNDHSFHMMLYPILCHCYCAQGELNSTRLPEIQSILSLK